MRIERFKDIEEWQLARELTRKVYERMVTQNGELRTCERLQHIEISDHFHGGSL
jgi:hypothetical protein